MIGLDKEWCFQVELVVIPGTLLNRGSDQLTVEPGTIASSKKLLYWQISVGQFSSEDVQTLRKRLKGDVEVHGRPIE